MLASRLFAGILLLSQLSMLGAQQYAFHEDGENEGLNSLTINCLLQDRKGFLWVGTENGLYEFEGSTYTRIGVAQGVLGTYITSLYEDAGGELWVGTTTNLYHGDGSRFTAIAAAQHGIAGTPGQQISSITPGQILAVSQSHLLRMVRASPGESWRVEPFFSTASLTAYPQLNHINSVYTDRAGSVWMGCGSAICEVSGTTARGTTVKTWGEKNGVSADDWCWFLEDNSGRIWARGFHHVRMLSPHGAEFADEDIPSARDNFATTFMPLAEDQHHRILTRTNQGLAIWSEGHWQTVGPANGLVVPGIQSLLVDHNGALWLGTYGKGVQRWLGYGNWETWTAGQEPGENPVVWSLTRDSRGTLWAATESGIVTFDPAQHRFVPWRPKAEAPRGQVFSVLEGRNGNIWFSATAQYLFRYDPSNGSTQHWTMPVQLRQVRQDSSGRIWILSGSGLYSFDAAAQKIVKVDDLAVPDKTFFDACEDPGHRLWFATRSGVVRYAGGRWSRIMLQGRQAVDGFASIACAADGTLWLGGTMSGANTGMMHLRVQGNVATPADPQPPPEFDSVEVMFLRRDRRGWLWVGSGSGVYVFNGARWRHITQDDGLTWNDCDEGAFFEDTDGSIWIGTANGLSHLLHPEEIFKPRPLRILAVNATLGNAPVSAGASNSFAWTREPLRVHMVSSSLADQDAIVYRYRLDGLDDDWAVTRSQELHYPSLPDGEYRLELYAEDVDRGLRSPVTVIAFRMLPPWWKALPFRLTLGVIFLALAYGLLRFRERRLIARQAQLEALVRQRTAELEIEKQQLMDAREALREQANRDALTGLLNYGAIQEVLEREMIRTRRVGSVITAVMIDIDLFKSVNDMHGHMAGDEVLREVARRLTDSIRPYDIAGRYGGEEFLLIMPDFDAARDFDRLAAVHDAVCLDPIGLAEGQVSITCSFGVSVLCADNETTREQLLDRADKALYKAKREGRNRIDFDVLSVAG